MSCEQNENSITERIELNLHTIMSSDASVITAKEAIETAIKMGHTAVAVTDRDSVQNFCAAAEMHNKYRGKIKVIYGAEVCIDSTYVTVLAKDRAGIKSLYEIISAKKITTEQREHILIGAKGRESYVSEWLNSEPEHLHEIAEFYDYIELPLPDDSDSSQFMVKQLYELGKKLKLPVVAVGNCHYINEEDRVCKAVFEAPDNGLAEALFGVSKFEPEPVSTHFRTTEEMLKMFTFLDEKEIYDVVVKNPNKISDSISDIDLLADNYPKFSLPDAYEKISKICEDKLELLYGQNVPMLIRERLNEELALIVDDASLFLLAHHMVEFLHEKSEKTGFRMTIGSTLVSYLLDISDVNPLPVHYYCKSCKYIEFTESNDGFDLQEKNCPCCGKIMCGDGHNIPFESCLKLAERFVPTMVIVVSQAMETESAEFIKDYLGSDCVALQQLLFYLSPKHANQRVEYYSNKYNVHFTPEERANIVSKISKMKRSEHAGKYYIILKPTGLDWDDFTPVYNLEPPIRGIDKAIHMDYNDIDSILSEIHVFSYPVYDNLKKLFDITGISIEDIDYYDRDVYQIFNDADTVGVHELSGAFYRDILKRLNVVNFSDLVKIISFAHSTNAWNDNGEFLLEKHPLHDLISNRDDIFLTLMSYGIERQTAYRIMEIVRKGSFCADNVNKNKELVRRNEELARIMESAGVPDWYIDSMKKIYYLFPKAHAVHYAKLAICFAWFKAHFPQQFYDVMLDTESIEHFSDYSNDELEQILNERVDSERNDIELLLEARKRGYKS